MTLNDDSILTNVKKNLNIDESIEVFDVDIITHINTVFVILWQLGIGPVNGFAIEDKTPKWEAYLGGGADADLNLSAVKTLVYLRVRMLFDPPTTSFHIEAMKTQIAELEWRLNVKREDESWAMPIVLPPTP